MSEEWRAAEVQGWGLDYTEVRVWCPQHVSCPWGHEWDDVTTLGEIVDTIEQHMREVHSGR